MKILDFLQKENIPFKSIGLYKEAFTHSSYANESNVHIPDYERLEFMGDAVAQVLFGDYNPGGRLPVTFYRNMSQLPDFEDYNMTGRTYRYMTQQPLFPFGYGLSYTTFEYGNLSLAKEQIKVGEPLKLTVNVTNNGQRDGAGLPQEAR